VILGVIETTEKNTGADVPALVVTVILASPALAIRLAGTVAVN